MTHFMRMLQINIGSFRESNNLPNLKGAKGHETSINIQKRLKEALVSDNQNDRKGLLRKLSRNIGKPIETEIHKQAILMVQSNDIRYNFHVLDFD